MKGEERIVTRGGKENGKGKHMNNRAMTIDIILTSNFTKVPLKKIQTRYMYACPENLLLNCFTNNKRIKSFLCIL